MTSSYLPPRWSWPACAGHLSAVPGTGQAGGRQVYVPVFDLPVRRTQTGDLAFPEAAYARCRPVPADRPAKFGLTRCRAPDSVRRARGLALGSPATLAEPPSPRASGPFVVFSSARVRHPGFRFNEHQAAYYCDAYGLDILGLRYAVGYGPNKVGSTSYPIIHELIEEPAVGQPGKVPYGESGINWLQSTIL